MTVHAAQKLDVNASVDELLAVVPYFSQHRSMTEAATELVIPFTRIQAIVEQIANIDQPGLPEVRAFEADYRDSFDIRIRPQATMLSQPHALTAEETAALLLVLEIIEDPATATSSGAAQTAATRFRNTLRTNVSIIDSTAAEDGKSFSFSERTYPALHQRKVSKVRYRNVSRQITARRLDCVDVYTIESTAYLHAVDRAQEDNRRKSFRVDRLGAAEAPSTPVGFHRAEPVDTRGSHTFDAETGTSEWASVLIDADATWVADYGPVFFTENEEGQKDAENIFDQGLGPSGFSTGMPISDLTAAVSFILHHLPNVTVAKPLELKNAVIAQARGALAECGRNDEV